MSEPRDDHEHNGEPGQGHGDQTTPHPTYSGPPETTPPQQEYVTPGQWQAGWVPPQQMALHRGGELVDVLPARAGRTDEAFLKLRLVDGDAVGDADHLRASWPAKYFFASTLPSSTAG